jgi:hypothetical protein
VKKIIIASALTLIVAVPFSCKKKEKTPEPTPSSTGSGTTTGGGTTTGPGVATPNTIKVQNGTSVTTETCSYISSNTSTSTPINTTFSGIGNNLIVGVSVSGATNVSGVFTINPFQQSATSGLVQVAIGGFTSTSGYIGYSGTFTASIVNNKQRIQFTNITCNATSATVTPQSIIVSSDYTQP